MTRALATQQAIYDLLLNHWPGRLVANDIARVAKRHPSTIRRNLWILEARGHAVKTRIHGEAYWVLTRRGEKAARADLTMRARAAWALDRRQPAGQS